MLVLDLSVVSNTTDHVNPPWLPSGAGTGQHCFLLALFLPLVIIDGVERSNPWPLLCWMLQGSTPFPFNIYVKLLGEIIHQHSVKYHQNGEDISFVPCTNIAGEASLVVMLRKASFGNWIREESSPWLPIFYETSIVKICWVTCSSGSHFPRKLYHISHSGYELLMINP